MSALLAFWSHALAALLFATLLLWQARRGLQGAAPRLLLAGLLLTAAWAWLRAINAAPFLTGHAETARNLVWIGLLYALSVSTRADGQRLQGVGLVYAAVAGVLGLQLIGDTLLLLLPDADGAAALRLTGSLLRITAAAGALVLVHNLYGQAAAASRSSIRLVMLALALTWVYDLNLHTLSYLSGEGGGMLDAARGGFVALTAPLFALGGQWTGGWRLRLSRAATFQSLSLLALCSYFVVMAVLATALRGTEANWTRLLAVALLAGMTVGALVLLPSPRARGWLKVKAAKHLFEHRYDYRSEWLRFADTLGRGGRDDAPLAERIVKALADLLEAPAGLLLVPDEHGRAEIAASWNWHERLPALGEAAHAELWDGLAARGRIVELDAHRDGWGDPADRALSVPQALLAERRLWVGVPLIHNGRAVGLALLAAPEVRRPLDWEDFDLLRTAGRQAASSLAEAHGQQALMNAQRFEEFNRRFAFILHDIKNLVSQLSLLTRNAERHADNPEFRTDMMATLRGSVGKMNELLARLSPQARLLDSHASASFSLLPLLTGLIADKRRSHEVRLLGQAAAEVTGDPAALEQAIGHLLQNAIDASPPRQPVTIRVHPDGAGVAIEIADRGCGMDSEFVRTRLFQPFASSKPHGFGIGAFEARALILAMGGQLAVHSRPGEGTRFTIHLKAAEPAEQKKSA